MSVSDEADNARWMSIYEKAFPVPDDCPPPNQRPHCPDCSGIVDSGIL